MPQLSNLHRVDPPEQLYPDRPLPDGQPFGIAATVNAQQEFAGKLSITSDHTDAVKQANASPDLTLTHEHLKAIMAPRYDTLDVLVNYGETVEEPHHFNIGWILTAVTLLPGVQASGTVHNPNVLFLDGLPRIRGGGGFGNSSRLSIPFALTPVDCYLEIPVEGRLYLHFSVQAASPGAMMSFPRVILRFQNWENGYPLEGGNQ